jgi:steroid 5-alpha reductase family enzyme
MKYFKPLLSFLIGCGILLVSNNFFEFTLINGALQLVLFILVVNIPAKLTGRMSYVDIGWPLGLTLIGILVLIYGQGADSKKLLAGVLFLFMGLRMGLMALLYLTKGAFKRELPRYQYQKLRWEKEGKANVTLAMQVEILVQAFANMSFLAMPALLIAWNPNPSFHWLEMVGVVLWVLSYCMESLADKQKNSFIAASVKAGNKRALCNVGLWRYSRHPNYFFEWMVWNSLIVIALPSLMALWSSESVVVMVALVGVLFMASRMMYTTLVHYTGAKPAEYYSVQKRPEYKEYQRTTSMFFPKKPML